MPIHDWTRVRSGTFHNFHFRWTASIMDRFNGGILPKGFFAMLERSDQRPETDFAHLLEQERYARKANRVAIHHGEGNVVAVIEIVSPGNKDTRPALRTFVEKVADLLRQGVNMLIVDLFPPGPLDPQGIHELIWDEVPGYPFELPPGKPLTLAAYQAEPTKTAYLEPVEVGQSLPDMPLFLVEDWYVNVPLEETYQATWNVLPVELRRLFGSDAPS